MDAGWLFCLLFCGIILGLFSNSPEVVSITAKRMASNTLTTDRLLKQLDDGTYQFCTQPDPKNKLDGAGACLNFQKLGSYVDGYYGYPHSNHYVCLQGQIEDDVLNGKGLIIIWSAENPELSPLQNEWRWGPEGRLSLNQGEIVHQETFNGDQLSWIEFEQAQLNLQGMYLYDHPRMTPSFLICDWH